jgi:very-short-patch-repair endonuclease
MECLFCKKPLNIKQQTRKRRFCSHRCGNLYRYKDVQKEFTCLNCGKLYIKKNGGLKQGTKYCSPNCVGAAKIGVKKTLEHRQRIAEGQKHVRKEGHYPCDRCGTVFESNTAVRAHKAHCGHVKQVHSCSKCNKSYKGLAALQRHQIWCLNQTTQQNKLKNAVSDSNIRRIKDGTMGIKAFDTNIEIIIQNKLIENNIKFEKQWTIDGVNHCYDFYLTDLDLIIEADGDYWHGNEVFFKPTKRSRQRLYVDINYTNKAIEKGHKIIRFWGSDLEQRVNECLKEALEFGYTGDLDVLKIARKITGV